MRRKAGKAARLLTALVALALGAQAQYLVPREERTTPRALAVMETYKNGSRRLIPVTFFFEKHYFDAALYHATPVPFTLYSETLYEVEQYGKPLGTFTVQSATLNPAQASGEWFGNGRFRPVPDAATLAARKKKPVHVVVEDPSRPVLHRREGSEGDNPPAQPSTAAAKPEADDDPDRPKLHRRQGSEAGDAQASAGGNASSGASNGNPGADTGSAGASPASPNQTAASQTEESSGQDPDRPKLQRKDGTGSGTPGASGTQSGTTSGSASAGGAASTSASTPASTPSPGAQTNAGTASAGAGKETAARAELRPSDDPDHPILRRGKPVQEQSGRDLPDLKLEEPVARQVAVSDAGPAGRTEGQDLIYVCPEPERQQMEALARELARVELRRLAAPRGLVLPAPDAAASAGSRTKRSAVDAKKTKPLDLKDEQFVPYDLDYNNYATVFYSARYSAEAEGSGGAAAVKGKSWVVTVIARPDSDGKLIKLYGAVSDPRELDLYPEVRLVDAVDPDGYGRHALLLREKKRDGVSWLLGRVTGYEMQTLFETASR